MSSYLDKYLDFYGCPAIVLPESHLSEWHGMLLPSVKSDESPDFIAKDGTTFFLDDTMDFEKPKTDYDRICQATLQSRKTHLLLNLNKAPLQVLALNIAKNLIRWEEHLQAFVFIETVENEDEVENDLKNIPLNALSWENPVIFEVKDSSLVLFNSSYHGEEITPEQSQRIEIAKGQYLVTSTFYATRNGSYTLVKLK